MFSRIKAKARALHLTVRQLRGKQAQGRVIPLEDLPEDAADWTNVDVQLDYLFPNTCLLCPDYPDELHEYCAMESADVDKFDPSRLRFIRTARIGWANYWLWRYTQSSGDEVFVYASAGGGACLGLAEPNGLTPEQWLLAEYHDEIYWS